MPVWFGLQVQTMPQHLTRALSHAHAPRMVVEFQPLKIDYRSIRYCMMSDSVLSRVRDTAQLGV